MEESQLALKMHASNWLVHSDRINYGEGEREERKVIMQVVDDLIAAVSREVHWKTERKKNEKAKW